MSNCYAIEDLIPVVDPTAYVHPMAVLIGDVIIGPHCYVGPAAFSREGRAGSRMIRMTSLAKTRAGMAASTTGNARSGALLERRGVVNARRLRGDFGRITLRNGVNVQDTCVIHGFPESDTIIETDGHIGHGAVIHGAHIGPNVLVGMNAVVMDRSEIGESSIIGAMSFLREGTIIPPRSLALGIPARVARQLNDEEIAWKRSGTREYQHLRFAASRASALSSPCV